MQLRYFGQSCFKIKTKSASLVTDPYSAKLPKIGAEIVTVSHNHPDHNCIEAIEGKPFIISGPGEYEIKEVSIQGIPTFHDTQNGELRGENIIYVITAEDLTLCHLGDLGHRLSPKLLEMIGDVDVLFVPTGWDKSLGPKAAAEVVNQIEPRLVIPMHYKTSLHKTEEYKDMAPVEEFLKEMGVEKQEMEKLVLSRSSLGEEMETVVLKPKF